jgi:hypothetical protein
MTLVNHPVSLWSVEHSGVLETIRALLISYQKGTDDIDTAGNNQLENRLEDAIELIFPRSNSSAEMDPEKRRLNMYYRLFGWILDGKNDFPKPTKHYSAFETTFRELMRNIFHGIIDNGNPNMIRVADPAKIAQLLNEMRQRLAEHSNSNGINRITDEWIVAFDLLIDLVNSNDLMNAASILAQGVNGRLVALGNKLNIPVKQDLQAHIQLAENMALLLRRIQTTNNWTPDMAQQMYTAEEDFFRTLSTAWASAWEEPQSFLDIALASRR